MNGCWELYKGSEALSVSLGQRIYDPVKVGLRQRYVTSTWFFNMCVDGVAREVALGLWARLVGCRFASESKYVSQLRLVAG